MTGTWCASAAALQQGCARTSAGKPFLEHAKLVLADVERGSLAVYEAGSAPSDSVAIGLPTTVSLGATLPILRACRERLPQVRLKVVEAYSGILKEWLQSGRLDPAILFGDKPEGGLNKRALPDEQLVVVASARATALPKKLSLERLAKWPLVLPSSEHGLRRIIDDARGPLGLRLDVVAEIDSLPSITKAMEAGKLQASRITNDRMSRRVVCASNVTRPSTPASGAVFTLIQDVIHDMVFSKSWPGHWIEWP